MSSQQHESPGFAERSRTARRRRTPAPEAQRTAPPLDEQPLRAELFSVSQLERHAKAMAGWHELETGKARRSDRLIARLSDNEVVLREAYRLLTAAVARGRQITPAAEWLIDNFHLIEQQIRTARKHFPEGYNRELPRLANAATPGSPRVYDLALELISHAHGRIDADGLRAFVAAYQSVAPLTLGELWAIPIMLRLALIENLRRVAASVTAGRRSRERAAYWCGEMLDVAASDPARVVLVLADLVDEDPPLTDAFVAELATRVQSQGQTLAFAMSWLEQRLSETGKSVEQVFEAVTQSQAADQVSIGNTIGSLRLLGAIDWRDFVETMSVVDHELRADPAGAFAAMDFATRDRYRHVIERLAKRAKKSELEVAQAAIACARANADKTTGVIDVEPKPPAHARTMHVGYFLIDNGLAVLERAVHGTPTLRQRVGRVAQPVRLAAYIIAIAAITGAATWALAALAPAELAGWATVAGVIALAVGTSQLAIAVVHWLATLAVKPCALPRLDFQAGIPAVHRTLVAVPAMLTSHDEVDELVDALEVRFLANRDPNLLFALVTDFRDAATETVAGDDALLARARERIEGLNATYAGVGMFLLLHRARRWNDRERVWMGWERKRGKLEELNAALRGDATRFDTVVGPLDAAQSVAYVIALDADTELPRDTAHLLAATLGHPLNRPCYDAARGRVIAGYAILQPRVAISLASTSRSRFARLFGGDPGIDPYTRAVSDVYQDLFEEGSFVGKGIYDVDAVRDALGGKLPENRILSHDLLEGAYARAGLVSDVLLIEDYPAAHAVDVSRRHRWIRGDWQILSWLFWRVPGAKRSAKNPITTLSRWKVFDNLRRSVVPIAIVALFVAGWVIPGPGMAVFATLAVLAVLFVPGILFSAAALARRPEDQALGMHVREVGRAFWQQLGRDAFSLACAPYDAWLAADAILRTWARLLLTRRQLLQWRTARDASRTAKTGLGAAWRAMWIAPLLAIAIGAVLITRDPQSLIVAAPVLALWLIAPVLSWWLSQTLEAPRPQLAATEVAFLHGLARRTWRFFERQVDADDNFLPPDNLQEDPPRGAAHRTSPTNIGLALTASLAAYDLGYITVGDVATRTTRTFATLDKLPRYRGHFYNWYDTVTLEPLRPTYVSTVDSGNLAGALIVLASGLAELERAPALPPRLFGGLGDALELVAAYAPAPRTELTRVLTALRAELATAQATPPDTAPALAAALQRIVNGASDLVRRTEADGLADAAAWAHAVQDQAKLAADELARLAPWLELPSTAQPLPAQLEQLPTLAATAELEALLPSITDGKLRAAITTAAERAIERVTELRRLAARARELAELDYDFLYDRERKLLAIGFNVGDHRLDASFYDLLASEARLASFVAIAQGKLPQEHWFSLGRLLTTTGGKPALLSWSGSMFEYLMPLLLMPTFDRTLLDDTYRGVVARQIAYGRERGVPWGVSESGYNKTDAQLNYQYRAFGVPGLGFQRGLADDLVIAPYATALALMVDPPAACANLQKLAAGGELGADGFYEALDYTPARVPPGRDHVTIKSYMAHHQGMALLALDYVLADRPMQRRFLAEPAFRATELLLQERVPRTLTVDPHPAEVAVVMAPPVAAEHDLRVFSSPNTIVPEVHLLSNGHYHVAITNAGGGYSRWRDLAVTRWNEDATRDAYGTFGYLRDVTSASSATSASSFGGSFWSIAHQPTLVRASSYEAIYSASRAEFRRRDREIDTHVEIAVSPEDDLELRRVNLTNTGQTARTLELTTFAEVVLATASSDAAHPAFSNLFVQTELIPAQQAILCTRRAQKPDDKPPWMFHLMTVHGASNVASAAIPAPTYETSRDAFIGRGRSTADPVAMYRDALSNTAGDVLDPIVAIRGRVVLAPNTTARIHVVTGVAETREGALALIEKYRDRNVAGRVFEMSWTHSQVLQRRLEASNADTQLYDRLASHVLYTNGALRAAKSLLARNRGTQSGLWAYGISGDLPIVLIRIGEIARLDLVRQAVKAHTYWRLKGLSCDLVIWNEDPGGYRQELQDEIVAVVSALGDPNLIDKQGGIFVRRAEQISEPDKVLIQTVARAIISDTDGTLADHLDRKPRIELPAQLMLTPGAPVIERTGVVPRQLPPRKKVTSDRPDLSAFNGLGGFTPDGREYVITTSLEHRTPAPWANVIANPWFGTVVTESGGAYTWCENAHEYRLTPWSNDAVTDTSGEAMFVRDEDDGRYWSPTPLPATGMTPYVSRHGFGYSIFEHEEHGISTELTTYVATDAPVKFVTIKLRNRSGKPRRISLTTCYELVLGPQRPANAPYIVTEVDLKTAGLFARNSYNGDMAARVAFLDCSEDQRTVTGDRLEMIGRNSSWANPACMTRTRLSGRVGAGYDPCLAMQLVVELADGQEKELAFSFGSGRDLADARTLVTRFRGVGAARSALDAVWGYWNKTLGAVNVQTPDPTLNFLANGWLLYQVLACRMWGRSGFYQSGGAYGFRDQLQDSAALLHAEPGLLRAQIVRAASRQFPQGDVQHWWHPPAGRGVRTRISDDYLWLPFVAARYVSAHGDTGVLDEKLPFLEGRLVKPDEDSYYDLPLRSDEIVTIYDHCKRAIQHGLTFGAHGLPLMGAGDWNDGMNLVGDHGKGESVWLGFFLYDVLIRFGAIARTRGDTAFADSCAAEATKLQAALEAQAWDGAWYRRAYFDDGSPLGSAQNPECQIDSLPQSWSVLSGAGDPARRPQALASLDSRLVDRELGLIELFQPPFDKSDMKPGYIKGYVPGVRENGGQYTHAAVWAVMAFAAAGETERAWELFGLINPVHHGDTPTAIATYKVEPYVVCADVYTNPQHRGRGGWTWYTGSAGWMYQLITESLLGIHLEVDNLRIEPRMPAAWTAFQIHYRYRETVYHLYINRKGDGSAVRSISMDGSDLPGKIIPLRDDRVEHHAEIVIG